MKLAQYICIQCTADSLPCGSQHLMISGGGWRQYMRYMQPSVYAWPLLTDVTFLVQVLFAQQLSTP